MEVVQGKIHVLLQKVGDCPLYSYMFGLKLWAGKTCPRSGKPSHCVEFVTTLVFLIRDFSRNVVSFRLKHKL